MRLTWSVWKLIGPDQLNQQRGGAQRSQSSAAEIFSANKGELIVHPRGTLGVLAKPRVVALRFGNQAQCGRDEKQRQT